MIDCRGMILALLAVLAAGGAVAQSAERTPKWGAHVDMEGKLGTDRNLGEADLFLPLSQNDVTLLFANLRTRFDDNDSVEGNFGLGIRHMLESGWNLGAYGYFDRRRTEFHNHFNQATFGLEALSLDWDLRGNMYVPFGRRVHQVDALNTAKVSDTSVVFRGGEEHSLSGFDAEIGWRVPVYDADADRQLRVYAGGYRFTADSVPDVSGPRLRAEMTFDSVPGLWEGSRFSVGAEWQHDDPRGGQGFLSARLRIPLQASRAQTASLTPMERRMADPVVRDIDVVSQSGDFGAPEQVTQTASGQTFTILSSSTTSGAALPGAVTAAGANSVVILSGTFSTTATTTLQAGQTLSGGYGLAVRSASGRVATISSPRATINANVDTTGAVDAANNSTISGLNVSNIGASGIGKTGVRVNGVTGVTVSNNVIYASEQGVNSSNGIVVTNSGSATISGNSITAVSNNNAGIATAINVLVAGSTVTVTDNTLSASGSTNSNRLLGLANGTIINTAASTGNTALTSGCVNLGATGFVSFTNGTTCP